MVFITAPKLCTSIFLFILHFLGDAGVDSMAVTLAFNLRSNVGMNVIDRCWRVSSNYAAHRQRLATCSAGFAGKMTKNRGPGLKRYIVTDPSDNPVAPREGTLRYGATLIPGKVWITFKTDMHIKLNRPLIISNRTVIDSRGADVHIAHGDGFLLHKVRNVIIHGLNFHHNRPTQAGPIISPGGQVHHHGRSDGDAVGIVSSSKVWIDHNTLSEGQDGLVDVTHGSTNITISNNWFRDHDKVMLLGHADGFTRDRDMKVTIAFNRFGPNCSQRMPRIRYGYAHVVNNLYDGWKEYAIGGSMNPSVTSQANVYVAPKSHKGVIWKRSWKGKGASWDLKSEDDDFINGAFFREESRGRGGPHYGPQQAFPVGSKEEVRALTRDAGALHCRVRTC